MKTFYTTFLIMFIGIWTVNAQAPGEIDLSFNSIDSGFFTYPQYATFGADGFDGNVDQREVYSMTLQSDGKILVGGRFQKYNHENKPFLVRLHPDGALDTTFNPDQSVINKGVYTIVIQPDGKILVGGYFYNDITGVRYIVRLNEDGSLDTTFHSSQSGLINYQAVAYANGIQSIVLQPDGKIIAGGIFKIQGSSQQHLIRLNADGSRDNSFDLGTVSLSIGNGISALGMQSDGKILVGASVNNQNGITQNGIVRFNPDGSLDTGFNTGGNGAGSWTRTATISLLDNGKILIGGSFTSYNGITRKSIARLNTDGSLDTSIDPAGSGGIRAIHILPNGKMMLVGEFSSINNQGYLYIARLNANGSIDATFNPNLGQGKGTDGKIFAMAVQPDGKILIGGDFMTYNDVGRKRIARVNPDGDLDITFNPGTGADRVVQSLAIQPDGKILIGGIFTIFNKEKRNGIARLNTDGTLDGSFISVLDEMLRSSPGLQTIVVKPDGKILIGGHFLRNGVSTALAQLNPDGSWDNSFQAFIGQHYNVKNFIVDPDGKILAVGNSIAIYDGAQVVRHNIVRFNPDGSLTPNSFVVDDFLTNRWFEGSTALALQPDGKTLVGGMFSCAIDNPNSSAPHTGITRLNADESVDISFNPNGTGASFMGANDNVLKIVLQPDGKILIGGRFDGYNGSPAARIARLHSDGTLDTTFHSPVSMESSSYIKDIVLQQDGKIVVVGRFNTYDGVGSKNIIRLNNDGTIDHSFNSGTGADFFIHAVVQQADRKIIIGGSFVSYNGTGKNHVARIHGSNEAPVLVSAPANQQVCSTQSGTATFIISDADNDVLQFNVSSSNNLIIPVQNISITNIGEEYTISYVALAQIGSSTISLVADDGHGESVMFSFVIDVNSAPNSVITQNGIELTANENNAVYQWIDCDMNQPISGEDNQSFTPTSNGNYAVMVTNTNGCSITSECVSITTLSLNEQNNNAPFKIYPNPATHEIVISHYESIKSIAIFDLAGKNIFENKLLNSNTVNVSDFSSGIYVIKITGVNGNTYNTKFIKK